MNSLNVANEIFQKNQSISFFHLHGFHAAPKLQDRLQHLSQEELSLVNVALELKQRSHMHFWEALLTAVAESGYCSPRIIEATLLHQSNRELIQVRPYLIGDLVAEGGLGDVACNSLVILDDGRRAHIPMLDFKIPPSDSATSVVLQCVQMLGLNGYVLNSGRSYHFWGLELITADELAILLAKFVLLHPISDKSWAAHQLIERSASLRVSARNGVFPSVVAKI